MTGNGKVLKYSGDAMRRLLPHSYPFTLLDTVERYEPERRFLLGLKRVSRNEPFLQGHFPEYPIFPGAIIIEALSQAAGALLNLDLAYRAGQVIDPLPEQSASRRFLAESRIKHMVGVYPGDVMSLEVEMLRSRDQLYVFRVCALVDGNEVTKGQLTMASSMEEAP